MASNNQLSSLAPPPTSADAPASTTTADDVEEIAPPPPRISAADGSPQLIRPDRRSRGRLPVVPPSPLGSSPSPGPDSRERCKRAARWTSPLSSVALCGSQQRPPRSSQQSTTSGDSSQREDDADAVNPAASCSSMASCSSDERSPAPRLERGRSRGLSTEARRERAAVTAAAAASYDARNSPLLCSAPPRLAAQRSWETNDEVGGGANEDSGGAPAIRRSISGAACPSALPSPLIGRGASPARPPGRQTSRDSIEDDPASGADQGVHNMRKLLKRDPQFMVKLFGRKATGRAEDEHDGERRPWVLHPLSRRRMAWELVVAALIVWSCFEVPFSVAFLRESIAPAHKAFDWVVDVIMIADVALTFCTGYVDADDHVTMGLPEIARHYARGWLFIDVISSLPFDEIVKAAANSQDTNLSLLRLIRLLRLLRLPKLIRYFGRWEEDLSPLTSHTGTRLVHLFLLFAIFIHLNSCLQWGVSSLQTPPFPPASWVHYGSSPLPLSSLPEPGAVFVCYSHAFFVALSHMLSIGYGLDSPELLGELWATVASMLMGAVFYAISVATACNIISSTDHPSRVYQNTLESANEFMRVRCLPKATSAAMTSHLLPTSCCQFNTNGAAGEVAGSPE